MNLAFWKRKQPIQVGHSTDGPGELNKHSATWAFVTTWATEQIQKLREKNDNPGLSEAQTAVLRGKIKAYRELLDLPNERKGILTK
ncbi:MAG: hypothetical protein EOM17_16245 [Synergistales bacterium]|nr:hypothetical protein [Synergistales bacterium]